MRSMLALNVVAVALLCQTVLSSPFYLASSVPHPKVRAPNRRSAVEAFANSDTDYHTWAQRMVDEGKMWYPAERSVEIRSPKQKLETVVVRHANGGLSFRQQPPQAPDFIIDAIVCSGLGGSNENYEEGKQKFCSWAPTVADSSTDAAHYMLDNKLCNGGVLCDLQLSIVLYGGRWFIDNKLDSICGFWWDAIHKRCQGSGGSGKIIFQNNRDNLGDTCGKPSCKPGGNLVGTEIGSLWAEFFDHDDGATCPADGDHADMACFGLEPKNPKLYSNAVPERTVYRTWSHAQTMAPELVAICSIGFLKILIH
ncbi:hypothetical protein G7046_g2515 [Stylonectria norvegica]|nr:hypothetical protein G7046_g2515 [Stylonectria norvegica]